MWTAVLVFLLGFALLNLFAYGHAKKLLAFTKTGAKTGGPAELSAYEKARVLLTGVNVPRPHGQPTPSDMGLEYDDHRIRKNGVTLAGWHIPSRGGPMAVVLHHGYSVDKSSMLDEARALHELGYSVFLCDFRGSGDSSESYTTIGFHEAEDVVAVSDYVRHKLGYSRVALFGQSMGAAAVLRAIRHHELRPDAVIVESVFDKLRTTVEARFQLLGLPSFPGANLLLFWGGRQFDFDAAGHNPVEYASAVHCPILFLQGSDDPKARPEDARKVFDAVPGAKRFKEFPGVGHESILDQFPDQWRSIIASFLKEGEAPQKG